MTCKIKTINIDKQIGGFKLDFAGITESKIVPKKSESVESFVFMHSHHQFLCECICRQYSK